MKNIFKKIFKKDKSPEIIYISDEPVNLADLENPKYNPMEFNISRLESWRIEQIKQKHKDECGCDSKKFSYMFSFESGIGSNQLIVCSKCGRIYDVTDVDSW